MYVNKRDVLVTNPVYEVVTNYKIKSYDQFKFQILEI